MRNISLIPVFMNHYFTQTNFSVLQKNSHSFISEQTVIAIIKIFDFLLYAVFLFLYTALRCFK